MLGEVALTQADRLDAQVKAFGHFLGGVLLQKVGPTNLVVAALERWTAGCWNKAASAAERAMAVGGGGDKVVAAHARRGSFLRTGVESA